MIDFIRKNILLLVVFLTGAAVLIIEVTATRMLSSYFGSSIFTVSSVISVILFALSLGYYFGGRLADKKGSTTLFYSIIAISGVSVFLLQLINMFFAQAISRNFSLQDGPLVLSLLMFFLPGFLLGTLSPIVVTLQKKRLETDGLGKVAGDVFFWSTLGSITGSLCTGFILIPTFGVNQIIMGVGSGLVIMGLLGLAFTSSDFLSKTRYLLIIPFIIAAQFSFLYIQDFFRNPTIVYADDGLYGDIMIYDGVYDQQPTRFFRQDSDASSAMFLNSSDLVYDYTKYYDAYKLAKPSINDALIIGAGAYSIPKALLEKEKNAQVDVVDVEPSLYEVGKKYFNVPDDKRLTNHVEDGRRFLYDREKKYDLIFGDAFHFSIPAHLTTQEFLTLVKDRLQPEGMYVMNVIGTLEQTEPSFALSEMRTFQSVFPNSYFFAVSDPEQRGLQNLIFVGYNSDKKLTLSNTKFAEKQIDTAKLQLAEHALFTDNYAPVEFYISKSFGNH